MPPFFRILTSEYQKYRFTAWHNGSVVELVTLSVKLPRSVVVSTGTGDRLRTGISTRWAKKVRPQTHGHNSVKSKPVKFFFTGRSLGKVVVNLLHMLPHYRVKH